MDLKTLCEQIETHTSYDLYMILQSSRKMRKIGQNDGCKYGYSKMILTGELEFPDYGEGFINFMIYYSYQSNQHFARIVMKTIDDGDMGAWVEFESEEEAIKMIDNFAENYLQHLQVFPTLQELNQQVAKYGIWIDYE